MSETSNLEGPADAPSPRERLRMRIAVAALIVAGLANAALALCIIPRFARIFDDMFEGRPLPPVTTLIVQHQWASVALACLWLLMAMATVRSRRAQRHIGAIAIPMALQAIFTTGALVIPLVRMSHQVFGQ